MRFGRTILVLAVALSVAILPVTFAGATTAQSFEMADSGTADDCCAQEPFCDTSSKPMKRCAAMTACAAMCFGFTSPAVGGATLDSIGAVLNPTRVENIRLSRIGSPPFRPPRV